MKKFWILMLFTVCWLNGQQSDSTSQAIHLEGLPYYNFGKGVGVTSPDSLFQFNIRFRMQNRLTRYQSNDESTIEGQIRRLRLRFDGYVGDPRFLYVIQLSFSPKDVGALKDDGDLNIIRDAMIYYKPNKNWQFGIGQTKLPGNRQRVNSSGALQLTDRSINNAHFNIDRDFGIQAYYLHNHSQGFGYNIKTAISMGEGRNWTQTSDDHLAYTGRLEIYPFGAFESGGDYFEGDIKREATPKLMLGTTFHYNEKATREEGQYGDILWAPRDLKSFFVDAILKYNGWAAMASYMERNAQNPVTYNPEDASDFNYVYAGHGFDTQLSYIFRKNWEIIGRYSWMKPNDDIFAFTPKQNQTSLGVTKYIWEHAFKLQTELTLNNYEFFDGQKNDDWFLRFQIEIGI